jgi:hypothetical protein
VPIAFLKGVLVPKWRQKTRGAAILHHDSGWMRQLAACDLEDPRELSYLREQAVPLLGVTAECGVGSWGQGQPFGRPDPVRVSLRDIRGTTAMTLRSNLSESEAALWDRRNEVLVQGTTLMNEKPDMEDWTDQERRLWLYAIAIGNRLERLQ